MIHKWFGLIIFTALFSNFGLSAYLTAEWFGKSKAWASDCHKADAIVVSGGDTNARTDRLLNCIKKAGRQWLLSQARGPIKLVRPTLRLCQRAINGEGSRESHCYGRESSETTRQNTAEVKKIVDSRKIEDDFGNKRITTYASGATRFSAQFNDIEIRNHPVASDKNWSSWWWLTPWGWWLAIKLMKLEAVPRGCQIVRKFLLCRAGVDSSVAAARWLDH